MYGLEKAYGLKLLAGTKTSQPIPRRALDIANPRHPAHIPDHARFEVKPGPTMIPATQSRARAAKMIQNRKNLQAGRSDRSWSFLRANNSFNKA